MTQIRVGIDVGGTFTDAVAIDGETMQVIAQTKVPTTHDAETGVAAGIVTAASSILDDVDASADDVVFIAHGTTQATNALLEGDVETVGIIGLGQGIKGRRGKSETAIDDIDLDNGQRIPTEHAFVNTSEDDFEGAVVDALDDFEAVGVGAVVASQVFGVDDPEAEQRVVEIAKERGLPAVGANVVSKRYGLRVRTRTAVVNASILPRMVATSRSTDESIVEMGIDCPLMIMRSDGGVMSIDEMERRPIQTILSGPAAGVAGALMYQNVTDGIFIEVGGTSSDISIIERGKPKWKSAEIGGHTTFLRTLDIRTEGIAGGSMPRVEGDEVVEVGPRSAHIADLEYSVFANPEDIVDPELVWVTPKSDDPEYVAIETATGDRYAITPSGAANVLGLVDESAYAAGSIEAARKAFEPLAEELGTDVDGAARAILDVSVAKLKPVIESIIDEYELDPALLEVVGGGGGSAALIPYLDETSDYDTILAKNHEIISTVGVGLAMVRDVVERNVMDPSEDDIQAIRREAIDAVVGMGANQETVQTEVEFDGSKNLLRAVAEGSTELQTRDLAETSSTTQADRAATAAASLDVAEDEISLVGGTDGLSVYQTEETEDRFFGLLSKTKRRLCVVDGSGVVKLKLADGSVYDVTGDRLADGVSHVLDEESVYSNSSTKLPNVYVLHGNQIMDVSGMSKRDQILSLIDVELSDVPDDEELVILSEIP